MMNVVFDKMMVVSFNIKVKGTLGAYMSKYRLCFISILILIWRCSGFFCEVLYLMCWFVDYVTDLPYPSEKFDKVLCDAPFDKKHNIVGDPKAFYRDFLAEVHRWGCFFSLNHVDFLFKAMKFKCQAINLTQSGIIVIVFTNNIMYLILV